MITEFDPASASANINVVAPAPEERFIPSPNDPMEVARLVILDYLTDGKLTLRRWRGEWWEWTGTHWAKITDLDVKAVLYLFTEHAMWRGIDKKAVPFEAKWSPTRGKISNLFESMEVITATPDSTEAPDWVYSHRDDVQPRDLIAFANTLLDVTTREEIPNTPALFNLSSVPYDYSAQADEPKTWLKFLDSVWPDDPDSIALLQEWFGYVLSGRTNLQKLLLMLGPPRSGKGLIARILTSLIGTANVSGPTMGSFAQNFGLENLIGKSLAVVGDARIPNAVKDQVLEKILMIAGEDTLQVDIKHRKPWEGKLPVRLMIMSNDVPSFADESGALAARILPITTKISFVGKEDRTLEGRILPELPGILLWGLEGLDRLMKNGGRFTEPASAQEAMELYRAQSSPVGVFLSEWCELDPDASTTKEALYDAWRGWCEQAGRDRPGTLAGLAKNLFAAGKNVKAGKPRISGRQVPSFTGVRLVVEREPGTGYWVGLAPSDAD
ncbi:phage/plasmid primase, P4 family [Streptomyces sp. NBC_00012]|uniref:DNA primase family protein n=1 Tax=Streptomyces sp. NBC_00012 TaxID=2975621 RepID=UPI0032546584